jgi:quinol monooxygenase YgiN
MVEPADFAGGNPESRVCAHCDTSKPPEIRVTTYGLFRAKPGQGAQLAALLHEHVEFVKKLNGLQETFAGQSLDNPDHFLVFTKWEDFSGHDRMAHAVLNDADARRTFQEMMDVLETEPAFGRFAILE